MSEKRKNTMWTITAVSEKAFLYTISEEFTFESMDISKNDVRITFHRYEMDENGFHVGYCYWELIIPRAKRMDHQETIGGIPHLLEEYCLFPKAYDVKIKSHPRKGRGYYPPDLDFFYQEADGIIYYTLERLEEARFDAEERTWYLGDDEFKLP